MVFDEFHFVSDRLTLLAILKKTKTKKTKKQNQKKKKKKTEPYEIQGFNSKLLNHNMVYKRTCYP